MLINAHIRFIRTNFIIEIDGVPTDNKLCFVALVIIMESLRLGLVLLIVECGSVEVINEINCVACALKQLCVSIQCRSGLVVHFILQVMPAEVREELMNGRE